MNNEQFELTPELMQQFQQFMKMQQKQTIEPKEEVITQKSPKKITRKYLREKYANQTIELMNVTSGVVVYKTEKNDKFIWNKYGDINDLTIDDVLSMSDEFLKTPWLIVAEDDVDLIAGLGLKNNDKITTIMELAEDIETLDMYEFDELCELLEKDKNSNFLDNIASRIQLQITKGNLINYIKIARLEKALNKVFTQQKLK